jgi:predicted nucleic acid-binding protein
VPIVVSDTSPIRALGHLGLINLLQELFSDVLIPPAVERELRNPASGTATVDVNGIPFLRVQAPSDRNRVGQLCQTLDPGESEALALALEVRADLVLIDEAAGRAAAKRLGLTPIGVLGTLIRAKQRGRVGLLEPLIDRLQAELHFFISPQVRAEALRLAGEAT